MRMTEQRAAILGYLQGVYTHPTAEEVYTHVHKRLPHVSRATIFRNLKQLSAQGKLLEIETPKASRFDGHTEFHQHVVCKKCNALMDVSSAKAKKFAATLPKISGWKVISTSIIYQGLCKKCNKR